MCVAFVAASRNDSSFVITVPTSVGPIALEHLGLRAFHDCGEREHVFLLRDRRIRAIGAWMIVGRR